MAEGAMKRKITIITIITMAGGFLGSLYLLYEQDGFSKLGYTANASNAPIAIIGVLCFLNMIRHILVLRRLEK